MSRIGKKPVAIPAGVEVKFENGVVFVKGPKGELTQPVDENLVSVVVEDGNVIVSRDADSKEERSAHGLYRTLIHNMILGVIGQLHADAGSLGDKHTAVLKAEWFFYHLVFCTI